MASRFSASNVTVAVSNYNGIAIVGSCLASIRRLNAAPAEIMRNVIEKRLTQPG